jgi:hypothetical protein
MHPNHQIYQRTLKILEEYFQGEDDNLMIGQPSVAGENPLFAGQSSTTGMQFKF